MSAVKLSPETLPAGQGDPAATDPPRQERRAHVASSPTALGVGILVVIAVVGALYLARAFFVPLLIGILGSYALTPVVDVLKSWNVPRAVGAALVLGAIAAFLGWTSMALGDDATALIAKLPEAARKVREHVREVRAGGPTSLGKLQEAATTLQAAASDVAEDKKPARSAPPRVAAREPDASPWLQNFMLAQTAVLVSVVAQAPIVLLLTYFLLASGEHFRRKLVQFVGPSLSAKKDAVRILEEIDTQIQKNLLATIGANVLVAIGTWIAFAALGVEQAGAWGVAAGLTHFVPYLGPMAFAVASGIAGFMQFGTTTQALVVAGVSLVVATGAGMLVMTWLQSRFAKVNAAVLFIALLFFGWLWGVWGLLLGAPLVAIAKVICDRVDSLKPAGDLLGH